MPGRIVRILIVAGFMLVAAAMVLNLGAFPWITETFWYQGLALFVALNTLAFALLATLKMGYASGRSADRRLTGRERGGAAEPTGACCGAPAAAKRPDVAPRAAINGGSLPG